MRVVEAKLLALSTEAQAACKARLDGGRVDTEFAWAIRRCCGPRSCSTRLTLASCGLLGRPVHSPRLPKPEHVHPRARNAARFSATGNVDRFKPCFARVDAPPPPGPVSDVGQAGEHKVELLLNHRTVRGVTRHLRRAGG